MVNADQVEPNVHTYGALIDGCARAGEVAKAFGAYGRNNEVQESETRWSCIRCTYHCMWSIRSCGWCNFDMLAEMRAETQPIDPDHITVGALIKTCTNAGQS